jgi:hypothetical protein
MSRPVVLRMENSDDHDQNPLLARRHIVGSIGIGLAAVVPTIAQGNKLMANEGLQNPADKYPKPSYKKQSQPWPGLASKMDPRPDHGEESYRGSGRLAGRRALRALILAAKDVEAIARHLNRTPLAVRHRVRKLGLTFRKIERRGRQPRR